MKKLHIVHTILTAVLLALVLMLGYSQYRVMLVLDYMLLSNEVERLKGNKPCGFESSDARTYEARR